MTTRYVFELILKGTDAESAAHASLNALDAESPQLAAREVEKALLAGAADEAVLYVPVRMLRAFRKVEIVDMNGREARERPVVEIADQTASK